MMAQPIQTFISMIAIMYDNVCLYIFRVLIMAQPIETFISMIAIMYNNVCLYF